MGLSEKLKEIEDPKEKIEFIINKYIEDYKSIEKLDQIIGKDLGGEIKLESYHSINDSSVMIIYTSRVSNKPSLNYGFMFKSTIENLKKMLLDKSFHLLLLSGKIGLKLEKKSYEPSIEDVTIYSGYDYDNKYTPADFIKFLGNHLKLKNLPNDSTVEMSRMEIAEGVYMKLSTEFFNNPLSERYGFGKINNKINQVYKLSTISNQHKIYAVSKNSTEQFLGYYDDKFYDVIITGFLIKINDYKGYIPAIIENILKSGNNIEVKIKYPISPYESIIGIEDIPIDPLIFIKDYENQYIL